MFGFKAQALVVFLFRALHGSSTADCVESAMRSASCRTASPLRSCRWIARAWRSASLLPPAQLTFRPFFCVAI